MNAEIDIQTIVDRVREMEQYMDEVSKELERAPGELTKNTGLQIKADKLKNYMESGQWLADYEADERGDLPRDLKRGVLSQDGLHNLLCELKKAEESSLYEQIKAYLPWNEQEAADKEEMLRFIENNSNCLLRENKTAHFTASVWAVNKERTKVLMIYHNIYNSWAWVGGHADGEANLRGVAMRELNEETGVTRASLVMNDIFSLETVIVNGHEKHGAYVPSHLHMNLTYLVEVDETEQLVIKEDENQGVKWWPLEEALKASTEAWMVERIYKKLIEKCKER